MFCSIYQARFPHASDGAHLCWIWEQVKGRKRFDSSFAEGRLATVTVFDSCLSMSGRKQHFIPQTHLKAFGSRRRKKTYIKVFRHGQAPFVSPTNDVGAKREYYSSVSNIGDKTLDDRITDLEDLIAKDLQNLRRLPDRSKVDGQKAARIIAHLITRNDHFRQLMLTALLSFTDDLRKQSKQIEVMKNALGADKYDNESALVRSFDEAIRNRPFLEEKLGDKKEIFKRALFEHVSNNFETYYDPENSGLSEFLSFLDQNTDYFLEDTQKKILSDSLIPPIRQEQYARFEWEVRDTEHQVLMPDCLAISRDQNGKFYPLVLSNGDESELILMPISATRTLVGRASSEVHRKSIFCI